MQVIDVRDLLDRPGSSKAVRLDEAVEGLHLELADLPEGSPVRGDLLVASVVEGILVSGALRGRIMLRCARCLREFDRDFEVEVSELFAPAPEDDEYPMDPAGYIDPEPMVRDAVALSVPFSPLCRPDCLGLCERCGGDRNLGQCTCTGPPADPSWAGLRKVHR